MKNIFRIFASDLKKLLKNKVALIIVCGLIVLPSLYAWFNIYASWDPYGNTSGIKVAVCNQDKGGKIQNIDINIGEEVISNLEENASLGWQFIDNPHEAIELVNKGTVYATIIIPSDFSEKMSTILDDNPFKPSLEYYVNEKINAISPKITDKGATTIQNQISTAFVETVTKQVFDMLKELGLEVEDLEPAFDKYQNRLSKLIDTIPTAIDRLNSTSDLLKEGTEMIDMSTENIQFFDTVLKDLTSFSNDFKKDLDKLNNNSSEISRNTIETLDLVKLSLQNIDRNILGLQEKILLTKPDLTNRLNDASSDLKTIVDDLRSLQSTFESLGDNLSPDITTIFDTLNSQADELQSLLNQISSSEFNISKITQLVNSIVTINSNIRDSLYAIDSKLMNLSNSVNIRYRDVSNISNNLSHLFTEMDGKTETTETAKDICDNITIAMQDLRKELGDTPSPILINLNTVEKNIKNLIANKSVSSSLSNLKEEQKKLQVYQDEYKSLSNHISNIHGNISSIVNLTNSIDTNLVTLNRDLVNFTNNLKYYSSALSKDITKVRTSLNNISETLNQETSYIKPIIKEVTDISLSRLDELSNLLQDVSTNLENTGTLETSLNNMHNTNSNILSNIDNLILKINTDFTPSIQRYLSNTSKFLSDLSDMLLNITSKSPAIENFLSSLSKHGSVSADDLKELSKDLPIIQENLVSINNKLIEVKKTSHLDGFLNKIENNKGIISDFMAYPVDLTTHSLYHVDNYGSSMTPFYTTLSLWVGVLVLGSLLTTQSKNINFKATPLETHLGKYLLFASLAVLQGLVVSLGDIFLLKVSVSDSFLLVFMCMFLSLVFCTIVYTLISLFGNVGKAMGVILLVLQVAGSGGTFPIQMTPDFFQRLYSWLPFTYGIGALRESISGVFYPALKFDVLILLLYFVVFLVAGILLISFTYKHLKKMSHILEESGIVE